MGNTETKKVSRKEKVGKVVSNKMNKTIVVEVSRRHAHPQFKEGSSTDGRYSMYRRDQTSFQTQTLEFGKGCQTR